VRDYRSSHRVDAFSVPFPDRPVVVLSSVKGKHDRSRFDAAHELGHLVMHNNVTDTSKEIEAQAHRFAGRSSCQRPAYATNYLRQPATSEPSSN
jgi:Zn-dependent peptidase ImmA (M78 family)